eukprot:GHVH01010448.1.p1 GENE.GHVH01010448.1~~GHVH01010448.1.p1  ORF type:complete len:116 (+),score=10.43 GHVH01010448.1:315-662(+)
MPETGADYDSTVRRLRQQFSELPVFDAQNEEAFEDYFDELSKLHKGQMVSVEVCRRYFKDDSKTHCQRRKNLRHVHKPRRINRRTRPIPFYEHSVLPKTVYRPGHSDEVRLWSTR